MSVRIRVNGNLKTRPLTTDEKIRAYNYRFRCSLDARNDPNICSTGVRPFSESCLEASDKEHRENMRRVPWVSDPFVNVDHNGGN